MRIGPVLLACIVAIASQADARPRAKASARPAAVTPPPAAPPPVAPAAGGGKAEQRIVPPVVFERLSYAEGLPNSHVIAIAQDAIGFMWFGTQDGLARYDGTRFRVFRPIEKDPTSVSASYITALSLDDTGRLWVGTAEQGINVYDPTKDKFTRYTTGAKGGPSSAGATAIIRDGKNRMWFAMTGGGVNRFDPATNTFVPYLVETPITAIDSDAKDNLWLGTESDGVIRWNPADGTTAAFPFTDEAGAASAPVKSVLVASTGKVWVGTDGAGVISFDPATLKAERYRAGDDIDSISDDHVTNLFEDRQKNIWFGTLHGLNKIDPSGAVEQYHHDPNDPKSLGFDGVESLYQDRGGVMWVGGFILGLSLFDEVQSTFGRYRTRTHPAVGFYEDDDGSVWIGTYHGGLWKMDWAKRRATIWPTLTDAADGSSIALETAWIPLVHRDRRGMLWMSLQGQGVLALDTKTMKATRYAPDPDAGGLPVDTVWDIIDDESGVWFATWGGGLVKFDPATSKFTAFTTETTPGMTSDHLYTVQRDPKAKTVLWIGSAKGGLIRFDTAASKATSFRTQAENPATLSSDDVLSVYPDPNGIVWAGTYGGGLNRVEVASGKVQRFTTNNSKLTNDVIFGVLPDDEGKLWMSTNGGGLVRLDPKDNTFFAYDVGDGLQGNEFAQNAYMRSKTGRLYFGGVDGFNAFMPKEIKRDTFVPPVVMTGFKMFTSDQKLGQPIWTLPKVEVSYADSFEVQFAALSFAASEKNRYAYKLEGFDDKFIETDRPFATYTKLDGGKYTLRVRAANRHGVWNEKGIALNLSVTPPFWRTWPAYIGYLLLAGGLAFLVVYLQRQRVRRVEREGRLAVVERDLALTGAVQSGFLPENNESLGAQVRLHGFYKGADACSGDWWWHERFAGRHAILVGDVTGHGPGPAMVTAAVATAFRVMVEKGLGDLREALEVLHRVVVQVGKGKYSMTMAALDIDDETGEWVLYSAGAPPMMVLTGQGKHRTVFCPGSPLGTDNTFEPGRVEGQLQPSERILLYTDGIPEIMLPNGNALGLRRLGQIFEKTKGKELGAVAADIVAAATQAQAGKPQDDDWTFTVVEWAGSSAQA